jgi:hypothetical protein
MLGCAASILGMAALSPGVSGVCSNSLEEININIAM